MNCPNCGANNAPGAKFCVGCGSNLAAASQQNAQQYTQQQNVQQRPQQQNVQQHPQQQNVQQSAPVAKAPKAKVDFGAVKNQLTGIGSSVSAKVKSLMSNKLALAGVAGGLALLVILIVVCSILGGGNGFNKVKSTILIQNTDKNEYSVIVNKKVLSTTIESESGEPTLISSADGSTAAILTEEGELFVVSGKKLKDVADDVKNVAISLNGKYLAYTTRGEKDEEITLHHCKVSNTKSEEISDEIIGISDFAISPNGKSVAYFVAGGEEGDPDELMFFNGKKSTKVADDGGTLFGLSDGGKEIYVGILEKDEEEEEPKDDSDEEYDADAYAEAASTSSSQNTLYAYTKNGDRTSLGSYVVGWTSGSFIFFNDDHRQVMFTNEEGKTYISNKGKKPDGKASSDRLEMLIPTGSAAKYCNTTGTFTYPVSNLFNQVYQTSDSSVWLIKKNADKSVKLVSKATNASIDESGDYVYYNYDGEELRCIKISHGEKASEKYKTIIEDYAPSSYYVTSNRKFVYYTEKDSVYSVNGKKGGVPKEISEDVEGSITLSGKDIMYYITDGDLYACSNGKKGKKVASDVDSVITYATGYTYATSDDAIYGTTGAKKPKKLTDIDT